MIALNLVFGGWFSTLWSRHFSRECGRLWPFILTKLVLAESAHRELVQTWYVLCNAWGRRFFFILYTCTSRQFPKTDCISGRTNEWRLFSRVLHLLLWFWILETVVPFSMRMHCAILCLYLRDAFLATKWIRLCMSNRLPNIFRMLLLLLDHLFHLLRASFGDISWLL